MKWILMALAVMASPVHAQECFTGKPTKVAYSDGHVITVIQRHGDDLTYTMPHEGFQDLVMKTHLMLFPKQIRAGERSTEYRWTSRLPKLRDMVPGFRFDIKGTMKSGDGVALPYRHVGEVLREDVVKVGGCSFAVLVVAMDTYLNDEIIIRATNYLSPDMTVLLKSEFVRKSAGRQAEYTAVSLQ